jgi:pimeloyl-ACP methyl ester carboxylesterase
VLPGIARSARVCAYDRPGTLRYSENQGSITTRTSPVPMPRTAADVVTDLHTLLRAADVPGPYVLVAHSLGGIFSRLHQRTYPDEVRAMVLVDTFSPEVPQLFGPLWPAYRDLLNTTGTGTDPAAERIDLDTSMRPVPLAVISKTEPFGGPPPDPPPAASPAPTSNASGHRSRPAWWPSSRRPADRWPPGATTTSRSANPILIISATRPVVARAGG